MDPALLRERELFKKRALSTPAVEKRPAASDSGSHKKKKPKVDKESSSGSKHSAGEWSTHFSLSCMAGYQYTTCISLQHMILALITVVLFTVSRDIPFNIFYSWYGLFLNVITLIVPVFFRKLKQLLPFVMLFLFIIHCHAPYSSSNPLNLSGSPIYISLNDQKAWNKQTFFIVCFVSKQSRLS